MKEGALVSIIMPAYNAGLFIAEAIESVIEQTYSAWELIIINDGSTDNTSEVIARFDDARIQSYTTPNKGVSAARNLGLEHMKGTFFCFLDADDAFPEESIAIRLRRFSGRPNVAFVDGYVQRMDSSLQIINRIQKPSFQGPPLEELVRITGRCFSGSTWMFRNDKGRNYKFAEGLTHAEDLLFCIHNADQGEYDFVESPVLKYRNGNTSAMSNIDGSKAGYLFLYQELLLLETSVSKEAITEYCSKTRSIIVKSYFKNGQFLKAVHACTMYR